MRVGCMTPLGMEGTSHLQVAEMGKHDVGHGLKAEA